MENFDNCAPIQCRQCGQTAAFANAKGYRCDECGYLMSWSFFKVCKLKCGCEKCLSDLQQPFWQQIGPHSLGQDYQDFQI